MDEYEFDIAGLKFTAQLSDEDVKRYDARPVSKAKTPANKSRSAANKGD